MYDDACDDSYWQDYWSSLFICPKLAILLTSNSGNWLIISSLNATMLDYKLYACCTKIKHVWYPGPWPTVLCSGVRVTEENKGNDDGHTLHDIWEAEV
jgi:hypothetical protein